MRQQHAAKVVLPPMRMADHDALSAVPYRRQQPWTNWGKTAHCSPAFTFYPHSLEDLQRIVLFAHSTERKVRVVGAGHSWSELVTTTDILVATKHLNTVTMNLSDAARPRVVVECGATGRQVNDVLERYGYALPLNVVLESVRYGGLIATGSHGSGWNNPTLSDLVSSLEIVTANGELRTFETGVASDEVMNAVRLNLGLFGIMYRITLDVQPTWHVHARDQRAQIDDVFNHLPDWVPDHDNFDLFWWPFCDQFWVKTWDSVDAAITEKPRQSLRDRIEAGVGSRWLRESLRLARHAPALTPAISQTIFRATPSQQDKIVDIVEAIHYRRAIEVARMGCVEVAFKVDPAFDRVKWAIQTVLDMTGIYAARGEYPFSVTMNVRFINKSACWLSPAFGDGHTCYIEILSSQRTEAWRRFSGEVARQWLQLPHARPHWAKEFRHIPGVIEYLRDALEPNIARFNAIKDQLQVDPDDMFMNDALKEIFA